MKYCGWIFLCLGKYSFISYGNYRKKKAITVTVIAFGGLRKSLFDFICFVAPTHYPTSATDKTNQLIILSKNYQSEGESDNADAAYVLSKRYRSTRRVHDVWTDYAAVERNLEYSDSIIKNYGHILPLQ